MKEEFKILCELFRVLHEAKSILGQDNWTEIRRRLIEGSMKTKEAEFLQNLRRDETAKSLGMTRPEFEDFLETPPKIKTTY